MAGWNNKELGRAIEERDYRKISRLLKAGADINECIYFVHATGGGSFPRHNPVTYAVVKKDLKLLGFLTMKGALAVEVKGPLSGGKAGTPSLFSRGYGEKIHGMLCRAALRAMAEERQEPEFNTVNSLQNKWRRVLSGTLRQELTACAMEKRNETAVKILKIMAERVFRCHGRLRDR